MYVNMNVGLNIYILMHPNNNLFHMKQLQADTKTKTDVLLMKFSRMMQFLFSNIMTCFEKDNRSLRIGIQSKEKLPIFFIHRTDEYENSIRPYMSGMGYII